MKQTTRISYVIMLVLLVLVGWLHMATVLLTTLFGYFALNLFCLRGRKSVAIALYGTTILAVSCGLYFFVKQAYVSLPLIADSAIPAAVSFAEKNGIEVPFSDYASLKTVAVTEVKDKVVNVGRYARTAAVELASLIIGLVVAAGIFLNARIEVEDDPHAVKDSLYSQVAQELALRFKTFYHSFATVIGAQITISAINTTLTAIFLLWAGFPYVTVIVGLTFLCGLLPIVGNLFSNTLIVGVGFTLSPHMALFALIFLIVIHKFEYFLNSKIIGHHIKNPMWLTLLGLVLGEKLMGIPGMILAPVVLHYIKVEASKNKPNDTVAKDKKTP